MLGSAIVIFSYVAIAVIVVRFLAVATREDREWEEMHREEGEDDEL